MTDDNELNTIIIGKTVEVGLTVIQNILQETEEEKKEKKTKRILVVGETGTGKSALCYHLGCKEVKSSDKPIGETATYQTCRSDIKSLTITDTCGFNEGDLGMITKEEAAGKFYKFCKDNKQGFNLVFLVKHPRNSENSDKNCGLVKAILPEVPIILVSQRCRTEWVHEPCKCKLQPAHTYGHHIPKEVVTSINVNLPGQDILENPEFDPPGPKLKKQIEEDVEKLKNIIEKYGDKRYLITDEGFFRGVVFMFNKLWAGLTGKLAIFTKQMDKVKEILVKNGMMESTAKGIISAIEVEYLAKE